MTITDIAPRTGQQAVNASVARQLADAGEFVDAHDVPLTPYVMITIPVWAPSLAEVDRWAGRLGVTASWNPARTQYSAEHVHGPNVRTAIIHVVHEDEAAAA